MKISILIRLFFYGSLILQIPVTNASDWCCKFNKNVEKIKINQQAEAPANPTSHKSSTDTLSNFEKITEDTNAPVNFTSHPISTETLTKFESYLYRTILLYLDFDSQETYTFILVILHYKPNYDDLIPPENEDVTFYQHLHFLRSIYYAAYQDRTSVAKIKRWIELCRLDPILDDSIRIPYSKPTNCRQDGLFCDVIWVKSTGTYYLVSVKVKVVTENFIYNVRTKEFSCRNMFRSPTSIPMVFLFTFVDQYILPQIKFVSNLTISQINFAEMFHFITDIAQHRIRIELISDRLWVTILVISTLGDECKYTMNFSPAKRVARNIYKYSFQNLDITKRYAFRGRWFCPDKLDKLKQPYLGLTEEENTEILCFENIYIQYN